MQYEYYRLRDVVRTRPIDGSKADTKRRVEGVR